MASSVIPTIDFSPFCRSSDKAGQKNAKDQITHACTEFGFFQAVNHGVPLPLMKQAMSLSKTFFSHPIQEKLKCKAGPGVPQPAGYGTQPDHSPDKNEYLSIFARGSPNNVLPSNPLSSIFKKSMEVLKVVLSLCMIGTGREVHEEIFSQFTNLGYRVEDILNDCLGLPPNFLKEYNTDRSSDFLVALHYFPATGEGNSGKSDHEDGNFFTFVLQDNVGGLEVYQNGEWIPVPPAEGTIVVNVGDVLQVLSNDKFKSATHRVVRPKGTDRHSYAFFYNLNGDRWLEPLPHFTAQIDEPPKYRGFVYKEYVKMRVLDRINPPTNLDDRVRISHYAIST